MRVRDESKIQAITAKAIEMVANDGLENLGINRLAKAAGVSPATIYIYYKDKDDLLTRISEEEGLKMCYSSLDGFDPEMRFAEGLWIQWKNRAKYSMNNYQAAQFFDQLRNSPYKETMLRSVADAFRKPITIYLTNAFNRGEINQMSMEVYWSIAFAPLYSLIRFHHDKHNIGGDPFTLTEDVMKQTFDYVIKALLK
ncbi:TetR/AcrR family transcriptional regulator [Chitinophaga nivalis]|uniref:TetR/AcrR family transcriptional regulator n=1 Tax=Chitinophaga nivalis TaxID=2991709 RepID=A0ABT3IGF4_9BACT|nr:TetR/AcrR family transcriptional regulator [Chitinophaga nivalis]MCW3467297.1 TetR/AcrR family transcriptional regulator [Chitinophaga nivalis]MCW3483011.1 TetR/AcrR family transcriptional regulator [Chitinophaga nivalis]